MRYPLFLPVACILIAGVCACNPKVSETTRIHGRVEGGTADLVTVTVLDYDLLNEPVEVKEGAFDYDLLTNPAVAAEFTCYLDGLPIQQSLIPDGSELTVVFSPEGSTLTSSDRKSLNYRFAEENQLAREIAPWNRQYVDLLRAGAPQESLDSLFALFRPTLEKQHAYSLEDFEKQKDNYLGVQALQNLSGDMTDAQLDSMISTLAPDVISTVSIQVLLDHLHGAKDTRPGMPFVDFSIGTENGTVRLSDYVGKGKYVLADFWASWCEPCLAEIPYLKEAYKKYNGPDFTILGIAVGDDPEDSRSAVREHGLPWKQIFVGMHTDVIEAYDIKSIPEMVLFGPDGTILRRGIRGADIGIFLKEYLE